MKKLIIPLLDMSEVAKAVGEHPGLDTPSLARFLFIVHGHGDEVFLDFCEPSRKCLGHVVVTNLVKYRALSFTEIRSL